jgi:hypothetical protein
VTDLHEMAEVARAMTPEQHDAFRAYRARPVNDELGPIPECRPLVERAAAAVAMLGIVAGFIF